MSRIRASQMLNGRFRTPTSASGCGCSGSVPDVLLAEPKNLIYDNVMSNDSTLFTNRIQPVNGLLEDWLGSKDSTLTTIGVKLDTQSTVKIALGIGGGLLLGAILKNALKIK